MSGWEPVECGSGWGCRLRLALVSFLLAAGTPEIRFIDIAAQAGLTIPNTFGGKEKKDYILESTGTGAAIFDYNGDGANDIFIANGTTLDPNAPPTRSQLYRNDGRGHFTEVGQQAGLTRTGWAQAACVGDFDNDGHPDLFVTYYGHNSLYRNLGDGKFADVSAAGRPARHRYAMGFRLRRLSITMATAIWISSSQTMSTSI